MNAPAMNANTARKTARQSPPPRLAEPVPGSSPGTRSRRRANRGGRPLAAGLILAAAAFLPPAPSFAQTAPAAPTVTVHAGDQALTVTWTAPSGVTGITAYDLRWILTADDETVAENWTVVDDAWTSGPLRYDITGLFGLGLTNDLGVDVQMRTVTTQDGSWSATVAKTPTDPGDTQATAADLTLGVPLIGQMKDRDPDVYKLVLNRKTDLMIFPSFFTDPFNPLPLSIAASLGKDVGKTGAFLAISSQSDFVGGPNGGRSFLFAQTLEPGTYYLAVFPNPRRFFTTTGKYRISATEIVDTTGASDAEEVAVGGFAYGLIDSGSDEDWFQFTLSGTTDLVLYADHRWQPGSGASTPLDDSIGELFDGSTSLARVEDSFLPGDYQDSFLIRRELAAGTYHVKVTGVTLTDGSETYATTGIYAFRMESVTEPGSSVAAAQELDLSQGPTLAAGRIDPSTDADYFKIVVPNDPDTNQPTETSVLLRATSATVDIDGEIVDAQGAAVTANVFEQNFPDGVKGFTISHLLATGTHYVKITRSGGASTGGYALVAHEDGGENVARQGCAPFPAVWSDPLSGCSWHLLNTGQVRGRGIGEDVNVQDVWTGGNMGAGIGVAVVDAGVHEDHPDLVDNVDKTRGHDYLGGQGQFDPSIHHGTAVAGVIAARDNGIGGRGVAPRATVYSYNLLLSLATDAQMADAMTRNMATTGASNNSWGFIDNAGLHAAAKTWEMAVETGLKTGFGGKGTVYVWAAGNGHDLNGYDNSNYDGRTNFHGVVAVCAVGAWGFPTFYSERGANLWVCAPSNDAWAGIVAPINYGRHTNNFGGTSAAAPMVAGVVALIRAANEDLTWRDVKLILAASARQGLLVYDPKWLDGAEKYGADGNYRFNHEYGFGIVDAKAAVALAADWTNVPEYRNVTGEATAVNLSVPDSLGAAVTSTVSISGLDFVEFVEIVVDFEAPSFRDLHVELVSPANRVSQLAGPLPIKWQNTGSPTEIGIPSNFRFGSARHLGENPNGTWTLRVKDRVNGNSAATLKSWKLKVYGHTTPSFGGGGGGGGPGGGGGGGGGGGSGDDDDDEDGGEGGGSGGGGGGGGFGAPKAVIAMDAACDDTLCRARTGTPVAFQDASTGAVRSRNWEFGDGAQSRSAAVRHSWSEPGFYEVTLRVNGGADDESTATLMFLVEAAEPAGTCTASGNDRCMQDSRYRVTVDVWRSGEEAQAQPANVVMAGTNDSALFWFFDPDNWEMLVKVLDGCTVNQHVWVVAAATTDLGYLIRVTDTTNGTVKEYRNEPGTPAPALLDLEAFPGGCRP